MEKDKDRLSILEKIERGEMSIEDAGAVLDRNTGGQGQETGQVPAEAEVAGKQEQVAEQTPAEIEVTDEQAPTETEVADEEEVKEIYVPTRRELKLALAERFQNWQPETMVGLENRDGSWQWPWKDKNWQWMWQDFDHPVYIGHSIDIPEDSELHIVSYQGDLFIRGWDDPTLKINGAIFDVRIGQDENITRIASSTGQLQIWVPNGIARVKAEVKPGDIWISNVSADLDIKCESGDLGCEQINGNIKAYVNGGDARLMGVEGAIDVTVIRGSGEVRDISSPDVNLKATEGDIWLTLDSVSSGNFRCENEEGDINLLLNGELACELLVEATEGGRISPLTLPWQKLLERSEGKLHGILNNGGATISLATKGGKIYIQESWLKRFPTISPS